MAGYCDVHTHLTHEKFAPDRDQVIQRAIAAGLEAIVVNGLEPNSNREILAMATQVPQIKPALGIYPIDAVNDMLPADFPIRVARFNVDQEIEFIRQQAQAGNMIAIGECGLDGHWVGEDTFARQEEVFEALIEIALTVNLPLIIHTRKCEQRAAEILAHHKVKRVNFHCFGGRTKWALKWAEEFGWWFSIPANARKNEAFAKMLRSLPPERILTETDAPYLAPEAGTRNEPANVVGTIAFLAEQRGWTVDDARLQIWQNYEALMQT
jgi:TatD DNase family protein